MTPTPAQSDETLRKQLHRLIIENRDGTGAIDASDQSAMADEILDLIAAEKARIFDAIEGAIGEDEKEPVLGWNWNKKVSERRKWRNEFRAELRAEIKRLREGSDETV